MKRLLKISCVALLFILAFTVIGTTVFANETEALIPADGEMGIIDEGQNAEDNVSDNVFETVYNKLMENADKIFSVLAFISSLVIALLYKKSFMPSVKSSMQGLAGVLKNYSEESRKEINGAGILIEAVNNRLLETERALTSLSDNLRSIEVDLDDKKGDTERLETIKKVISAEIDMLYDVFMSSSLPEYKKDEVGERVRNMKKELSSNDSLE